jgi:hypothetical protein
MQTRKRIHRCVFTVIAIVAMGWLLSTPRAASAQYQIDNYSGHMLDASNRIGSGGYNNASFSANAVNSNDIYLGNVTGYGGFKGFVPDRPPSDFQGYIPPQPSLLLQQQAGVSSLNYQTPNNLAPYYNIYTAPSSNVPLQQIPGTNSYLVAPAQYRQTQDYRIGAVATPNPANLPTPGEVVGPGEVNMSASMTPTFLSNAPLYGNTPLNQPLASQVGAPGSIGTGTALSQTGPGLASGLTQRDIMRLRGELAQNSLAPSASTLLQNGSTAAGTGSGTSTTPGQQPASPTAPVLGQITGNEPLGISADVTHKAAVQSGLITAPQGDASTGQSVHQIIPLPPPPAEQSPQYAKLRDLLQQYQTSHPKSDEESNRLFQKALQARRDYEQQLTKAPVPVKAPDNGTAEPAPTTPNSATPSEPQPSTTPPPAPLEVGSIGQGIRATGLSQLVQQGEDLARHQHFKDAINRLMEARQVAPNNMLIDVDLANAELGAGFYTESEQFLRDAFTADPALLMGRYDLKTEVGDDRLQVIITDLKQLAASGDSATPVFLLAYLSYNTGDTDKAVEYLHLAQTRAGGQDDVIRSLGEHWSLPTTQPTK